MKPVNVHPGEALQEFLDDYALSQSQLARELYVPVRRISIPLCGANAASPPIQPRGWPASSTTAPTSGSAFRSCSISTRPKGKK